MKKIEKLTRDQERELVEFRERMWRQGTCCLVADRAVAEQTIADAYAVVGKPKPKIFWMTSPMTCALALYVLQKFADETTRGFGTGLGPAGLGAGLWDGLGAGLGAGLWDGLRDGLWDGLGAGLGAGLWDGLGAGLRDGLGDGLGAGLGAGLRDGLWAGLGAGLGQTWWWGQMDTFWLAYYRFGSMIGCPQRGELLQRLDIMERIAASVGFWHPRDGICVISDRFAGVSWDGSRNRHGMPFRLHKSDGPAVSFRDGWGLYYWHGFRIPLSHHWIIAEKSRLTFDTIAQERNAELRRVMFEIALDVDPDIIVRNATLVSQDECHGQPRRLLQAHVGGQPIRILEVVNGTVESDGRRRKFHLGAMAGNTPHECVAASYGRNPERYREGDRT